MGILDGIVEWIAEQVMHGLDLINTSVLGALGCDMTVFLRYFPAAETMYEVFVALAIGLILLIWIWNLVKNFALGMGTEAEDPVKLSILAFLPFSCQLHLDRICLGQIIPNGSKTDHMVVASVRAAGFLRNHSVCSFHPQDSEPACFVVE